MKHALPLFSIVFLVTISSFSGCFLECKESTIYRGIYVSTMSFRPDENYGCSQSDIDLFKSWNCNSIAIPCNWDSRDEASYYNGIEPVEANVGNPITGENYSQISLARLHSVVDLAESNGLYVWLIMQPIAKGTVSSDFRWAQKYGNSFITFNEKPATTPMAGRDRYINFIKFICNEFPNCGIAPWWFPYHMDGSRLPNSQIESAYYNEVQPAFINAIRETDYIAGRQPRNIAIYPLLQGIWTGTDEVRRCTGGLMEGQQPYYPNDPYIYYGLNSHDGDAGRWGWIVRANERWNYDMQKFNDQWAGAVQFKQLHPKANLICQEWIGLCVQSYGDYPSCGERPINKTRIDWTKAMFEKAIELDMSWTYFAYSHIPLPGSSYINPENPTDNPDGVENEIASIIRYYNSL